MDDQGIPPNYQPMSMEEFSYLLGRAIQNMQLNNLQELMAITQHQREMERDEHKSWLKQNEYSSKQNAKTKIHDIQACNGEIRMEVMNGNGYIVERSILFSCGIVEMYRYKRNYTGESLWQIVLKDGDKAVYSELYPTEYIQSTSKLQKTIFAGYDCTIPAGQKNMAWKWLKNQLIAMYERAGELELPYLTGWFKSGEVQHFWTRTEDMKLLASEVISRYYVETFPDLSTEEIVDELAENVGIIAEKTDVEILLLFRAWAYLENLISDSPPVIGLTLIGPKAVEIAKKCLRTMYSEDDGIDVVNLDADRISQIREKVRLIRNTPVIFVSCNPDNKSTQNRLADVMSWMQSGYMEGTKVHGPFVFCLQEFSPSYPLDRTVVIDVRNNRIFDNFKSFAKMQSLLISIVENGGSYWGEEFKRQFQKLLEEEKSVDENSVVLALEAMTHTILRMLNVDEERTGILKEKLFGGLNEIKRQMPLKAGVLLEAFQKGVEKMVVTGIISTIGVQEDSTKSNDERLYFDNDHYYFSKDLLRKIAENLRLSRKAVLCLKQELSDNNLLKQYRKTANRRSELEVDTMVGHDEKRMRISVLAIKREFWDKTGGIALFEKGDVMDNEIDM